MLGEAGRILGDAFEKHFRGTKSEQPPQPVVAARTESPLHKYVQAFPSEGRVFLSAFLDATVGKHAARAQEKVGVHVSLQAFVCLRSSADINITHVLSWGMRAAAPSTACRIEAPA